MEIWTKFEIFLCWVYMYKTTSGHVCYYVLMFPGEPICEINPEGGSGNFCRKFCVNIFMNIFHSTEKRRYLVQHGACILPILVLVEIELGQIAQSQGLARDWMFLEPICICIYV